MLKMNANTDFQTSHTKLKIQKSIGKTNKKLNRVSITQKYKVKKKE